jgi:hypothetical protein
MEMFCLKELPLILEFSYILHKISISKEKSLSAKNEHQQPFHIVVSHNTPTMFLSGLHLTPQPSCSNIAAASNKMASLAARQKYQELRSLRPQHCVLATIRIIKGGKQK